MRVENVTPTNKTKLMVRFQSVVRSLVHSLLRYIWKYLQNVTSLFMTAAYSMNEGKYFGSLCSLALIRLNGNWITFWYFFYSVSRSNEVRNIKRFVGFQFAGNFNSFVSLIRCHRVRNACTNNSFLCTNGFPFSIKIQNAASNMPIHSGLQCENIARSGAEIVYVVSE